MIIKSFLTWAVCLSDDTNKIAKTHKFTRIIMLYFVGSSSFHLILAALGSSLVNRGSLYFAIHTLIFSFTILFLLYFIEVIINDFLKLQLFFDLLIDRLEKKLEKSEGSSELSDMLKKLNKFRSDGKRSA